jgi:hypothetical protein
MTNLTNAKFRIGTTGTLDGTKTHKLVLEGLFGVVRKVTTTKELMDQGHVADFLLKCLLLKYPDAVCQALKDANYQKEIEFLVLNESRNNFISNLALSLEGNTLILYQYVDKHGGPNHDMINRKSNGERSSSYTVRLTPTLVKISDTLLKRKKMQSLSLRLVLFLLGSTLGIFTILYLLLLLSRESETYSQSEEVCESQIQKTATLFDIADDLRYKKRENYTLKHFAERIKIYSDEKFIFKLYKIELKG